MQASLILIKEEIMGMTVSWHYSWKRENIIYIEKRVVNFGRRRKWKTEQTWMDVIASFSHGVHGRWEMRVNDLFQTNSGFWKLPEECVQERGLVLFSGASGGLTFAQIIFDVTIFPQKWWGVDKCKMHHDTCHNTERE